jgi:DivIVA domain-containing protein
MRDDESSRTSEGGAPESASTPEAQRSFVELRHYVPADLLNVSFPTSMRGYEREAVDSYVKRVNRVIAELKVSASPRSAVTHALEQTEKQVSGLLQRARETGEEITASARQEAEEILGKAKADAAQLHVNVSAETDAIKAEAEKVVSDARSEAEDMLARSRLQIENAAAEARAKAEKRRQQLEKELQALREQAEASLRELSADAERIRSERQQLFADIRERANQLLKLADTAPAREPDADHVEPEPVDEIERAGAEPTEAPATERDSPTPAKPGRAATKKRG